MTDEVTTTRREMIGAVTAGAVAVGAATVLASPAGAQVRTKALNANAKAVLPSGKILSRGEVLATLGLDPKTPPDAWLTIVACGSNASALRPDQLRDLVQAGKLNVREIDAASRARIGR